MPQEVKRGFVPSDAEEFHGAQLHKVRKAQKDLLYLLEQNYPIKSASAFVGNHYMLSERQRLAMVRATAARDTIESRINRQLTKEQVPEESRISVDGLNIIITLEVALSGSTLIRGMDGVIRDLAGLRGTYRLIDKTKDAILLIGDKLADMKISEAIFYLDSPVSNTGRLKTEIFELLGSYPFKISVELVHNADVLLEQSELVITGDAIILNKCKGWINLVAEICEEKLPEVRYVELTGREPLE